MAQRRLVDRLGIAAQAESGPGRLEDSEPGLFKKLEQPGRGRGPHGQIGIEIGLDLGGREKMLEIRTGAQRGLPDDPGNGRCRLTRRAGFDWHQGQRLRRRPAVPPGASPAEC
jgi:hypothetical protein